ncbi:nucleotidyltransferase domain-containing protein, partial [Candidatus Aerophobetes bacterium]|nr:nucleotidyltransferase domain-containing protein [Candidatus Aerophobetes bacterium]
MRKPVRKKCRKVAEKKLLEKLRKYFEKKENVILAFVFGSWVKGTFGEDSDIDIGVYLKDEKEEKSIWVELSRITGCKVDLVVLNSAPASLVSNIFKTGIPLAIKDKKLFWDIYLTKTSEAEDFYEFAKSYQDIYRRAKSLTPEDKTRLIERIQFLESEFKEIDYFESLTFKEY